MKVDKREFDQLLWKLLAAKPLPKAAIEPKMVRAGRTAPKPAKRTARCP